MNFFQRNSSGSSPYAAQDFVLPSQSSNHSSYSIFLHMNGKIQLIGFGLREYFLIENIFEPYNVLPKTLAKICKSVAKSTKKKVFERQLRDNTWKWEFSCDADNIIVAHLYNHHEFINSKDQVDSGLKASADSSKLEYENIPVSLCVTKKDTFDIVYANSKFQRMFNCSAQNTNNNISSIIKNKIILDDVKSSVVNEDQLNNIVFSYSQEGTSYWDNHNLVISANLRKSMIDAEEALVWVFEDLSELKNLQQQHELFKRKFDISIQAATEGIWEWSSLVENGDWWSKPMYSLLRLDNKDIQPSLELIMRMMHPHDKKNYKRLIVEELNVHKFFTMECRLAIKAEGFRWFRMKVVGAYDKQNDLKRLIGSLVDIHVEKTSRIQLQQEKNKAVATLNSIVDAVITTNKDGIIEYGNAAAERLTGINSSDLCGGAIDKIISFYKEHTTERIKNPVIGCLQTGERMKQKIYADMLDSDGARYTVQVMATPLLRKNTEVFGAVLVLNDVTNIRILSRRLKYQASHDILTKLINRNEFENKVSIAINRAREKNIRSAVLYIDLDRFKLINDICGHIAGDQLLKQVAKLLAGLAGDKALVARMGGDEFAILLGNCRLATAERFSKKVLSALESYRFSWNEKTFNVEASIGLAEISETCDSLTYILNAVDSACYLAKDAGRNCIRKYSEGDDSIIERKGQQQWIQRFDVALDNDELVLYAQPIIPLAKDSKAKMSLEILVRMLDSHGQIIPPNAFLPAVERFDRACKLDRWVIENTFKAIQNHPVEAQQLAKWSVNLSGQSMADTGLQNFIKEKTLEYSIDPAKICFEVTETAAIANLTTAIEMIEYLKADGFLFALDDFGSGLSSFAYLKTLPVDFLKIDGIFVKDMHTDRVNYAMVKAIQDMGQVLNKQTIAEYVENENVQTLLTELGVDYGQGYHLGKPRPIEEMLALTCEDTKTISAA